MGRPSRRPAIQAEIKRLAERGEELSPRGILAKTGGSLDTITEEIRLFQSKLATNAAPPEPPLPPALPSTTPTAPTVDHERLLALERGMQAMAETLRTGLHEVRHALTRADETYRTMMEEIDRARHVAPKAADPGDANALFLAEARLEAKTRENRQMERRINDLENQLREAGIEPV